MCSEVTPWKHELCGKTQRFFGASSEEVAAVLYLNHWLPGTGIAPVSLSFLLY